MSRTLLATPAVPGGATTGAPTTGAHKKFEIWPDSAGALWVCTAAGTPGTWVTSGVVTSYIINVKSYGAIGNGTTNDVAAFNSAKAACASTGAKLYIPPGTYLLTGGWTVDSLNDLEIMGDGTGSILTAGATDTVLTVTNCSRVNVHNLQIKNGSLGLSIYNDPDSHFYNLFLTGQTNGGVSLNGDNGMEQHWTDVMMRGVGGDAFTYVRTTTTDSGGLYMDRVRIVGPISGSNRGFVFTSSAGTPTPAYVWATDCVVDSYNHDCFYANNIAGTNFENCWMGMGSGATAGSHCLHITGGYTHRAINSRTIQGIAGSSILLDGGTHEVIVDNHIFDGSGAASCFGVAAAGGNIFFGNYYNYVGSFTDSWSNLISGVGASFAQPTTVMTRGSGGGADCVSYEDADSTGSPVKYLRNSAGVLQVLNGAFSAAILQLDDSGNLILTGSVSSPLVTMARTTTANIVTTGNSSNIIVEDFEIGSGLAYELSSDALLEIT